LAAAGIGVGKLAAMVGGKIKQDIAAHHHHVRRTTAVPYTTVPYPTGLCFQGAPSGLAARFC
jgi:hypothetical protein